jgi:cytochrome b561
MPIKNTPHQYGLISILLHWLVALTLVGLFALGLWMVELTYYDEWYKRAPDLHKSVGITLFGVMLLRLLWRIVNPRPGAVSTASRTEQRVAHTVHWLLYGLVFAVMLAGYLISTADGRAIEVFGLFNVPALVTGIPNMEDSAGQAHLVLAISLISLATLHALAALKHHFFDRDQTLRRMLGLGVAHKTSH